MDRQKNETYFEYLRRLTEMLNEGMIGFKEYGDYLLGEENTYSSDNLRKAFYVIRKLVPRIESDIQYDCDDEARYNQYRLIEKEAHKAAIKIQNKKRKIKKK